MTNDFLTKEYNCRLCAGRFSSKQVRKSAQPVLKTDSDFCVYYERETPYFYYVLVCPACGYAFSEAFNHQPPAKMKEKLSPLPDFFASKRDAPTAQLAYKRAIECALLQRESDTVLASLYLQLSWILRVKGDGAAEQTAQAEALKYYEAVYRDSDLEDASKVTYLIGELNRRLGNHKEAVYWYAKVANDKRAAQSIRHMARDAWQSLRS